MSTKQNDETQSRWYMVNKDGMCTLCADQADAEQAAVEAQDVWPHMGPHRAVRLVEASQAFTAADMATAAAQGFRDGQAVQAAVAAGWVNLPGTLPEPGNPVLLDIGKKYPIRAMWVPKFSEEVGSADFDGDEDYDEETDTSYWPEGWYEWNQYEEVHWAVSETPRAWCEMPAPLPPAPSTEGESNE